MYKIYCIIDVWVVEVGDISYIVYRGFIIFIFGVSPFVSTLFGKNVYWIQIQDISSN